MQSNRNGVLCSWMELPSRRHSHAVSQSNQITASISLSFNPSFFVSSYTPEDLLKIAQIEVALNNCAEVLALSVRQSFAGTVAAPAATKWLLEQAKDPHSRWHDEASRTLDAHTKFFPKSKQDKPRVRADYQHSFVRHFRLWPSGSLNYECV